MERDAVSASEAAFELTEYVLDAKVVPFTGSNIRIDRDTYLALVAKIRQRAHPITTFEERRSGASVSDLLDELERLGQESPGLPLTSEHRIDRDEVSDVMNRFGMAMLHVLERWSEERTHRIDLDDPDAPTLEALVDRVEREGQRFLISHQGAVLASLHSPG